MFSECLCCAVINSLNFSEFLLLDQLEKKAMKLSMQGTNRLTLKACGSSSRAAISHRTEFCVWSS